MRKVPPIKTAHLQYQKSKNNTILARITQSRKSLCWYKNLNNCNFNKPIVIIQSTFSSKILILMILFYSRKKNTKSVLWCDHSRICINLKNNNSSEYFQVVWITNNCCRRRFQAICVVKYSNCIFFDTEFSELDWLSGIVVVENKCLPNHFLLLLRFYRFNMHKLIWSILLIKEILESEHSF